VRLVHTSDLHLFAARSLDDDLAMVRSVAATVEALEADALAVAGDLFDHNRVPLEAAAELLAWLAAPGLPVVVLPGNHDPLTPDAVYRRVDRPSNLFVLGLDGEAAVIAEGWSVVGRAHVDYGDFPPLHPADEAGPDGSGRVVLAHGHYDLAGDAGARHRPGWLITPEDLDALAAEYVGLGHWDRAYEVRASGPPTYYSGSPWLTGSVNVVELAAGGPAVVTRVALRHPIANR
jgi:DNA repair exonuclease SbcCD nuclease subunit